MNKSTSMVKLGLVGAFMAMSLSGCISDMVGLTPNSDTSGEKQTLQAQKTGEFAEKTDTKIEKKVDSFIDKIFNKL